MRVVADWERDVGESTSPRMLLAVADEPATDEKLPWPIPARLQFDPEDDGSIRVRLPRRLPRWNRRVTAVGSFVGVAGIAAGFAFTVFPGNANPFIAAICILVFAAAASSVVLAIAVAGYASLAAQGCDLQILATDRVLVHDQHGWKAEASSDLAVGLFQAAVRVDAVEGAGKTTVRMTQVCLVLKDEPTRRLLLWSYRGPWHGGSSDARRVADLLDIDFVDFRRSVG